CESQTFCREPEEIGNELASVGVVADDFGLVGFTNSKDLFPILARQRSKKVHGTRGQLHRLFNTLVSKEAFLTGHGPKFEAMGVPRLEDEIPAVRSPFTPSSRLHFMEAGSVRGDFGDGHLVEHVIK